jgi:hypothetical protein
MLFNPSPTSLFGGSGNLLINRTMAAFLAKRFTWIEKPTGEKSPTNVLALFHFS